MSSSSQPPQKRRAAHWVQWSALGLVALTGIGLGVYFGVREDHHHTYTTTQSTEATQAPGGSSGSDDPSDAQTTSTTLDLGKAEAVDPGPSTVVHSNLYGLAPANNVLVVMEEGQSHAQAEQVAAQINGTVVGEIEYMSLYQIQTSGSTVQDLETAIETIRALPGVKSAAPNGIDSTKAAIQGVMCSPMRDPVYQIDNGFRPYQMIGMMEAWQIWGASDTLQHPVSVGIVDSQVYTQSGNGLAPELFFPDANGVFPAYRVKSRGLAAKDTTDQPSNSLPGGLTHATMVAHVIGADWDQGVTGVASGLGSRLTMSFGSPWAWNTSFLRNLEVISPGTVSDDLPLDALVTVEDPSGQPASYFVATFVEMIRLIENGATIINLSIGPYDAVTDTTDPDPRYAWRCSIYKDFLERMYIEHKDVLFVASAGNDNRALDGSNYGPGGIRAPNLITVGMLDRSGNRATPEDMKSTQFWEDTYDALRRDGDIPADMTLDAMIEGVRTGRLRSGSNYAIGEGEVTLSACGIDIPVGRYADGKPICVDGTSLTAPQVVAAAAIMRSIDPSLDAEQIKEILVRTAATEVTVGGTRVEVPANVGGRVLRVDRAVLEVINRMRPANDQLIYGDLIELATVTLSAEQTEIGYMVTASVPRVKPEGVDLMISLKGDAQILGETTQHRSTFGEVSWTVVPGDDPVTVYVNRLDSAGCASLKLPGGWPPAGTPASGGAPSGDQEIQGPHWILDETIVNPEKLPLEYRGGGSDPTFFPEERFKDMFVIYKVSKDGFTVNDRWRDREYEAWNVTISFDWDPLPQVLIPGDTVTLGASGRGSGTYDAGRNPFERFQYSSKGVALEGDVYMEVGVNPSMAETSATLTPSFIVPEPASAKAEIQITAGLWNRGPCSVTWVYKAAE